MSTPHPLGPPQRPDRTGPPPRSSMGLLDLVTATALDEDYAFVSARRGVPGPRRGIGVVGAVMMALFAALVAVAGIQTARNATSTERERVDLVRQVNAARARASSDRATIAALRAQTARLQAAQLAGDTSAQGLLGSIQRLGILSGTLPVSGPGVEVVVDDAPGAAAGSRRTVLDTDLQRLVNGFWQAGAEAIALNGQRLTNLSTIRVAGGAITVNARSLSRPYVVTVIGDKDQLPARFAETSSGQAWLDLKRSVGLGLTITPASSLTLPAAEVSLRYATTTTTPGGVP